MKNKPKEGNMLVCLLVGVAIGIAILSLLDNVDLPRLPNWAIVAGIIICLFLGWDCIKPNKKE